MTFQLGDANADGNLDVFRDGKLYGEYEFQIEKDRCRVRRVMELEDGGRKRFLPTKWQKLAMLTDVGMDKTLGNLFAELPWHSDYWPEE